MKIRKLKKSNHKKLIIGGMILVCILSLLIFNISRAKYKSEARYKFASGKVSYSLSDVSMIAMKQQASAGSDTYNDITEMPDGIKYEISSNSYCNKADGSRDNNAVLKTIDGNHVFNNVDKGGKCYLWFDKVVETAS